MSENNNTISRKKSRNNISNQQHRRTTAARPALAKEPSRMVVKEKTGPEEVALCDRHRGFVGEKKVSPRRGSGIEVPNENRISPRRNEFISPARADFMTGSGREKCDSLKLSDTFAMPKPKSSVVKVKKKIGLQHVQQSQLDIDTMSTIHRERDRRLQNYITTQNKIVRANVTKIKIKYANQRKQRDDAKSEIGSPIKPPPKKVVRDRSGSSRERLQKVREQARPKEPSPSKKIIPIRYEEPAEVDNHRVNTEKRDLRLKLQRSREHSRSATRPQAQVVTKCTAVGGRHRKVDDDHDDECDNDSVLLGEEPEVSVALPGHEDEDSNESDSDEETLVESVSVVNRKTSPKMPKIPVTPRRKDTQRKITKPPLPSAPPLPPGDAPFEREYSKVSDESESSSESEKDDAETIMEVESVREKRPKTPENMAHIPKAYREVRMSETEEEPNDSGSDITKASRVRTKKTLNQMHRSPNTHRSPSSHRSPSAHRSNYAHKSPPAHYSPTTSNITKKSSRSEVQAKSGKSPDSHKAKSVKSAFKPIARDAELSSSDESEEEEDKEERTKVKHSKRDCSPSIFSSEHSEASHVAKKVEGKRKVVKKQKHEISMSDDEIPDLTSSDDDEDDDDHSDHNDHDNGKGMEKKAPEDDVISLGENSNFTSVTGDLEDGEIEESVDDKAKNQPRKRAISPIRFIENSPHSSQRNESPRLSRSHQQSPRSGVSRTDMSPPKRLERQMSKSSHRSHHSSLSRHSNHDERRDKSPTKYYSRKEDEISNSGLSATSSKKRHRSPENKDFRSKQPRH